MRPARAERNKPSMSNVSAMRSGILDGLKLKLFDTIQTGFGWVGVESGTECTEYASSGGVIPAPPLRSRASKFWGAANAHRSGKLRLCDIDDLAN